MPMWAVEKQYYEMPELVGFQTMVILVPNAPLSELLVAPQTFSPGGNRTHTTRGKEFWSQKLYQLSYRGILLKKAKYKFQPDLCIFHHFSIIS